MAKRHYLSLLRGINVGGNNIIKMVDLKACYEQMGFGDVTTYIQSGNVIFSSEEKNLEKLTVKIEEALSRTFSYKSRVIVLKGRMLQEVVEEAPKGFGQRPDQYRYDVIFIKPPLTAKQALKDIPLKEGVDTVHAGTHALYFSRLTERATQSRLSKIVQLPLYQQVSIRNWNTTTKLLALMEKTFKKETREVQ